MDSKSTRIRFRAVKSTPKSQNYAKLEESQTTEKTKPPSLSKVMANAMKNMYL